MSVSTAIVLLAAASASLYLFLAICLRRMSKDTDIGKSWYAFVPVLNVYLACRLAGKRYLWTVLVFVPVVNIVMLVLISVKISRLKGRGRLYGLLMVVPVIDLPLLWLLSFRASPAPGSSS